MESRGVRREISQAQAMDAALAGGGIHPLTRERVGGGETARITLLLRRLGHDLFGSEPAR
jgi:hypothetical protein